MVTGKQAAHHQRNLLLAHAALVCGKNPEDLFALRHDLDRLLPLDVTSAAGAQLQKQTSVTSESLAALENLSVNGQESEQRVTSCQSIDGSGSRADTPTPRPVVSVASGQRSLADFAQAVSASGSPHVMTQPSLALQSPAVAPASSASSDVRHVTSSNSTVASFNIDRQMSHSPIDVVTPLVDGTDVTTANAATAQVSSMQAPAAVNSSHFLDSISHFASDYTNQTPAFAAFPKPTSQPTPPTFCPIPFAPPLPPPPAYQDLKSPDSGIGETCLSPETPKPANAVKYKPMKI